MSGLFFVKKGGKVGTYFGRWMGERSTAVFLRGPGYAYDMVTDLDRVERPVPAAAGFLLDLDARRAVVFDAGILWSADDAEDPSMPPPLGTALRADDLARLDLLPEERVLVDIARRGTTKEALLEALHAAPLRDSYRGWSITWVPTHEALVEASKSLPSPTHPASG